MENNRQGSCIDWKHNWNHLANSRCKWKIQCAGCEGLGKSSCSGNRNTVVYRCWNKEDVQSRVDTNINNVATLFWFVSKLEIASFSIVTVPTKMFLTRKHHSLATSVIQIRDIWAEASTCMNCICINKDKRSSRMTSIFGVGLKNSAGQLRSTIFC